MSLLAFVLVTRTLAPVAYGVLVVGTVTNRSSYHSSLGDFLCYARYTLSPFHRLFFPRSPTPGDERHTCSVRSCCCWRSNVKRKKNAHGVYLNLTTTIKRACFFCCLLCRWQTLPGFGYVSAQLVPYRSNVVCAGKQQQRRTIPRVLGDGQISSCTPLRTTPTRHHLSRLTRALIGSDRQRSQCHAARPDSANYTISSGSSAVTEGIPTGPTAERQGRRGPRGKRSSKRSLSLGAHRNKTHRNPTERRSFVVARHAPG